MNVGHMGWLPEVFDHSVTVDRSFHNGVDESYISADLTDALLPDQFQSENQSSLPNIRDNSEDYFPADVYNPFLSRAGFIAYDVLTVEQNRDMLASREFGWSDPVDSDHNNFVCYLHCNYHGRPHPEESIVHPTRYHEDMSLHERRIHASLTDEQQRELNSIRHLEYMNQHDQIVCQMTHTNICVKCRLYTDGIGERSGRRDRDPGNGIVEHMNCKMFAQKFPRGGAAASDGPAGHYWEDRYDDIIFLNLTLCTRCSQEMDLCFENYNTQDAAYWQHEALNDDATFTLHQMKIFGDEMCEITRTIFLNVFGYELGSTQDEERRTHLLGRRQQDLTSIAEEEQRLITRRRQTEAEWLEARARQAERERLQQDAQWASNLEVQKYNTFNQGDFDISHLTASDEQIATALQAWECKICYNGINIGAQGLDANDSSVPSNEQELKELVSAHAGHDGEACIILHVFHKRCLETHAESCDLQHRKQSCPSCRQDMDREPLPAAVREARSQHTGDVGAAVGKQITFEMRIGDNPYFISQCISCSPLRL